MGYITNPHSNDPFSDRSEEPMMYDGDGHHGTRIDGRGSKAKQEIISQRAAQEFAAVLEAERDEVAGEPWTLDDDALREDDVRARAYSQLWDHYQASYNATKYRDMNERYLQFIFDMVSAILGKQIDLNSNVEDIVKLIWQAGQERARLLERIEQSQETISVATTSISSQQNLIQSMAREASQGRRAREAFALLCVQLGVNPIPMGEPEEMAAQIRGLFLNEENERDRAMTLLQQLSDYAGGGRDGSLEEMAAHVKGAISV